jgi:hypothetical protein
MTNQPPVTRIAKLSAEGRIARVAAELPRVATVAAESRIVRLAPEPRVAFVAAENRVLRLSGSGGPVVVGFPTGPVA